MLAWHLKFVALVLFGEEFGTCNGLFNLYLVYVWLFTLSQFHSGFNTSLKDWKNLIWVDLCSCREKHIRKELYAKTKKGSCNRLLIKVTPVKLL